MSSRRRFLRSSLGALAATSAGSFTFSALLVGVAQAHTIVAVRVWPAPDYSRVTIETDRPLEASHFTVDSPDRLVVDIQGLTVDAALRDLVAKVQTNDPYIQQVRVGQNKPTVVRIVFDLKTRVNPQVFSLPPVGEYKYRLVFDLYPEQAADPLMALLDEHGKPIDPNASSNSNAPRSGLAEAPGEPLSSSTPAQESTLKPANAGVARMITIALDPGHGGEDPGATGAGGTHEKFVALSIAQRVRAKIDSESNMRCMMTRDSDYFVPLNVRVQKARRIQADLFVSIHADAFVNSDAHGSSVFALSESGASSSAARWLANKENDADLIGGANINTRDQQLARVLLDLSTTAQINDSLKLGNAVLHEIGGVNRLHKDSVEQAGFAVLKAPDIPSILIETAFISNPDEERRLIDEAYQDHMAEAIVKGIKRYFAKNPPLAKTRLVS